MKKLMLTLMMYPILLFGQDKVRFIAAGVTCSMCSNAIHKSLSADSSIKKINPNLQTQVWNLEYPKGQFNLLTLKKEVENAGFSLSKVWINGELVYEASKKRKKK